MYFASVESAHGEEFIVAGTSIDDAVKNLRGVTSEYNPEDIQFFRAEPIKVMVNVTFTEM